MARQHGITTNTSGRIVLDSGALYLNRDEAGAALIGATRGGAVQIQGTRTWFIN